MAADALTATALRDAIAAGRISAEEACRDALTRIAASNDTLHAFHTVEEDRAIERPVITCGEVRQLDERTSSLPLSDLRWSDLELGSRTRPAVAATGRSVTHRDGRPSWSACSA